jgi:hypothetical protein
VQGDYVVDAQASVIGEPLEVRRNAGVVKNGQYDIGR